ncbi:DNA/RNA non-specific endonuclease, partial [Klebsiella pneumoniae]|uniref:DNA/RNA non-specific endonuclease n=2 Tax=Pseudomonadota TaxID=1224 RepID=UPI002730EE24
CLARFSPVGLPRHRGDDVALKQILICRDGYALSFNKATRNPDWVIERLTPAALKGAAKRADKFQKDPAAGEFSPTPQDYTDPA